MTDAQNRDAIDEFLDREKPRDPCGRCGGLGGIACFRCSGCGAHQKPVWERCPVCDGTGVLPGVPQAVEFTYPDGESVRVLIAE